MDRSLLGFEPKRHKGTESDSQPNREAGAARSPLDSAFCTGEVGFGCDPVKLAHSLKHDRRSLETWPGDSLTSNDSGRSTCNRRGKRALQVCGEGLGKKHFKDVRLKLTPRKWWVGWGGVGWSGGVGWHSGWGEVG